MRFHFLVIDTEKSFALSNTVGYTECEEAVAFVDNHAWSRYRPQENRNNLGVGVERR